MLFLSLMMMKIRRNSLLALMAALALLVACRTSLFSSFSYEDVSEQRAPDQTTFEDSAKVFFATYPNPYPDKEFLWFAVFIDGDVEMQVHDFESDSLQSVYHFMKQDIPVRTVAMHEDNSHLVKCVLYVDGRKKCAKVYPAWQPVQIPQFTTQYEISGH